VSRGTKTSLESLMGLSSCSSRYRTELKIEIHLSFAAFVILTHLHCDICCFVIFSGESSTNKAVLAATGFFWIVHFKTCPSSALVGQHFEGGGGGKALFYLEETVFVEEYSKSETFLKYRLHLQKTELKFLYFSWRLFTFQRTEDYRETQTKYSHRNFS
jgi:hypothetical protein